MGLVLTALLWLVGRWLWRQGGRPASTGRKALILSAFASCVLILSLLVGGLQFLWLERRNQAVTAEDLRILERADAFLKDESAWNRKDDRQCDDDKARGSGASPARSISPVSRNSGTTITRGRLFRKCASSSRKPLAAGSSKGA
jgi:hypothetical protein